MAKNGYRQFRKSVLNMWCHQLCSTTRCLLLWFVHGNGTTRCTFTQNFVWSMPDFTTLYLSLDNRPKSIELMIIMMTEEDDGKIVYAQLLCALVTPTIFCIALEEREIQQERQCYKSWDAPCKTRREGEEELHCDPRNLNQCKPVLHTFIWKVRIN